MAIGPRFRIALRNVARNRRRTLVNVLMIAGGIAAAIVFGGFAHNILGIMKETTIQAQFGHIQVARLSAWNPKAGDSPKARAFRMDDALVKSLAQVPGVDSISGRISHYGLVGLSGSQSVSALGIGVDLAKEKQFNERMKIVKGRRLTSDDKFEVVIGSGLLEQIGAQVGSTLTLVAYTHDGALNAIDCEIVGTFRSGVAEVDNVTYYAPLGTVQRLLDTDHVERIVVMLDETDSTNATKAALTKLLPESLAPRTWFELSALYRQMLNYAGVQNSLIETILLSLAILAIANTVGMSIAERTGEIGTARALGERRRDVFFQFLLEGLALGVLGGLAGCVLGYFSAHLLTALEIPIDMPGSSQSVPIRIDILPLAFAKAFALGTLVAIAASALPALNASRMNVVDALRRNV